ncbi:hypothetical protein JKP88DRAFT_313194 [Tribonema minus]|uniref:Protein kinase domain-containing protein n=1 Tax=Tribonema minus TaxID=303371 RepID=A0A835Z2A6_9STRA|nr:hypothetical protein JKP88DRAFT_313194 [Tribonema minus]
MEVDECLPEPPLPPIRSSDIQAALDCDDTAEASRFVREFEVQEMLPVRSSWLEHSWLPHTEEVVRGSPQSWQEWARKGWVELSTEDGETPVAKAHVRMANAQAARSLSLSWRSAESPPSRPPATPRRCAALQALCVPWAEGGCAGGCAGGCGGGSDRDSTSSEASSSDSEFGSDGDGGAARAARRRHPELRVAEPKRVNRAARLPPRAAAATQAAAAEGAATAPPPLPPPPALRISSFLLLPCVATLDEWLCAQAAADAPSAAAAAAAAVPPPRRWRHRRCMLVAVAAALAELHGLGLVHAAVHPRHVWTNGMTCYLGGLEHVRSAGWRAGSSGGSGAAAAEGDDAYASPEVRSGGAADSHADTYALGVLYLELWCSCAYAGAAARAAAAAALRACAAGAGVPVILAAADAAAASAVAVSAASAAAQPAALAQTAAATAGGSGSGAAWAPRAELDEALLSRLLSADAYERPDAFEVVEALWSHVQGDHG